MSLENERPRRRRRGETVTMEDTERLHKNGRIAQTVRRVSRLRAEVF